VADRKQISFGRLAQGTTGPQELVEAEAAHGRAEGFAALDALIGRLALRSLSGEVPFRIEGADEARSTGRMATIRLGGLDDEERLVLDESFSLEKQQARGSWSSQAKITGRLQRYAVVLDHGLIGCLVQYRGCRGPLLILTEPR